MVSVSWLTIQANILENLLADHKSETLDVDIQIGATGRTSGGSIHLLIDRELHLRVSSAPQSRHTTYGGTSIRSQRTRKRACE